MDVLDLDPITGGDCGGFVIIPFIQKRANNDQALRDELNKAFYKDRLKELEEETEEGIVADQQDLIADLKQTLLDDIPTQQNISRKIVFHCGWLPCLQYCW